MTGHGTAVPSCAAVMPVPIQSPRSDGTVILTAWPSPGALCFTQNTQIAGVLQLLVWNISPPLQRLSGKNYPQIQQQTFNTHLLRRDFRPIPTLCSNSFLSCFSAHADI